MSYFEHIPIEEQNSEWFLLLDPLLKARIGRNNLDQSDLIQCLKREQGGSSWKTIKKMIEDNLKHVKDGKKIFERIPEIENHENPDYPIQDMFSEFRAIPYLLQKGFLSLKYFRQDGIDFHGMFEGQNYYIEVTYIHGPDLKTFCHNPDPYYYSDPAKPKPEWDYSRKLINLLTSKYAQKESQFLKRHLPLLNCLILIITDLIETHEPWFNHVTVDGKHPIQSFVNSQKIATIIHGAGSVYEPDPSSLNGAFGRLNKFAWENYCS